MPSKHIKKELINDGYSIEDLTSVILDVNEYKNFVPHCSASRILKKEKNFLLAEITISFSIFKVSYVSEINFSTKDNKATIEVRESRKKTFKHLLNVWNLEVREDKIFVDFFVDFEIQKRILNAAATASLPVISEIILHAFIKRIKQIK